MLLAVDQVRVIEADRNAWVEVTLHEGKQHEVKRLLEAVGVEVEPLQQVGSSKTRHRGNEGGIVRERLLEEPLLCLVVGAVLGGIATPGGQVEAAGKSDAVVDEPGLTLPHPRMLERRFVQVRQGRFLGEAWPATTRRADAVRAARRRSVVGRAPGSEPETG